MGRARTLLDRVAAEVAGRLPPVGFTFRLIMRGQYRFEDAVRRRQDARPVFMQIAASSESLRRFFMPVGEDPGAGLVTLQGEFTADGWAERVAIENGSLRVTLASDRRLRYHFTFTGPGRVRYRFEGVQHFVTRSSLYALHAEIFPVESAAAVATAELRVDPEQVMPFLLSLRLARKS